MLQMYNSHTPSSLSVSSDKMDTPFMTSSNGKVGVDCIDSAVGEKRTLVPVSDDDTNKKPRHELTAEEKKMKRVMANRRSARESRERRKKLLTNLEASVEILSKENASLVRENSDLRKQLQLLLPQANLGGLLGGHNQSMQGASGGLPPLYSNAMRNEASQMLQLQKEQQLLEVMRRRQAF
mmetsp:Transcript_46898/g.69735  ORF Transcript_46898/g.69735 Transcript_46898/m.69735 type:complete len:181 (-) Transcript_46898:231-773(-)